MGVANIVEEVATVTVVGAYSRMHQLSLNRSLITVVAWTAATHCWLELLQVAMCRGMQ